VNGGVRTPFHLDQARGSVNLFCFVSLMFFNRMKHVVRTLFTRVESFGQ